MTREAERMPIRQMRIRRVEVDSVGSVVTTRAFVAFVESLVRVIIGSLFICSIDRLKPNLFICSVGSLVRCQTKMQRMEMGSVGYGIPTCAIIASTNLFI